MVRDELMQRQASVCRARRSLNNHIAALCSQPLPCDLYFKDALKIKPGHILLSRSTCHSTLDTEGPQGSGEQTYLREQRRFCLDRGKIFVIANIHWHASFYRRPSQIWNSKENLVEVVMVIKEKCALCPKNSSHFAAYNY